MNLSTVIKLSQKLEKEVQFICESVCITDEDILPILDCAPFVTESLNKAAMAQSIDGELICFDSARRACADIDGMLILMYATNIISRETFTRIRNSYASLGRNLAARCALINKKIRQAKRMDKAQTL